MRVINKLLFLNFNATKENMIDLGAEYRGRPRYVYEMLYGKCPFKCMGE